MSSISKKEAQKKLKEEKKRIKEEQKRLKREEASRKKKGAPAKPAVGQVIGAPTNFSHDTHVGWDTEHGFELRNIPMEWKRLFKDAGVTRAEIEDPETRKLIMNTVRQSMYAGAPGAPPPPPAPAPPPPPPAPGAPPPPPSGGGAGFGLIASPKVKKDPYAIGSNVKAVWSGDGQSYSAKIDSVREEDGYKYFMVTFTEYGNQEEVGQDGITPEGGDLSAREQQGLEHLLKLQANSLKPPDIANISESQEVTIVDHLQKALAARRNGFVSVYGVETVGAGAAAEEWEAEDDSWMDF